MVRIHISFPFDANTSTLETGFVRFFFFHDYSLTNFGRCQSPVNRNDFVISMSIVHVSPPKFFAIEPFCNRSFEWISCCLSPFLFFYSFWQWPFGVAECELVICFFLCGHWQRTPNIYCSKITHSNRTTPTPNVKFSPQLDLYQQYNTVLLKWRRLNRRRRRRQRHDECISRNSGSTGKRHKARMRKKQNEKEEEWNTQRMSEQLPPQVQWQAQFNMDA